MAQSFGLRRAVVASSSCLHAQVTKARPESRLGCFLHTAACRGTWAGLQLRTRSLPVVQGPWPRRHYRSAAVAAAAPSGDEAAAASASGGEFDFDLFTLGAGSGGVRASRFAAGAGARVAVCELPFGLLSSSTTGGVGGTCVLRGCVPKKLLVYGAKFAHEFESSAGFGWSFPEAPVHDWPTLVANKNKELERLLGVYKNLLAGSKVTLMEGRGKVSGPHEVEVDGKRYTAKHILVAVGGEASKPPVPGAELAITSDEALSLAERPSSIAIIGGGYIALEFAGIFNSLGSRVDVFIRQPKPLRGFDEEVRDAVTKALEQEGIHFHFGHNPKAVRRQESSGLLALDTVDAAGQVQETSAEVVMFATGRRPRTEGLGLEEVGVDLAPNGAIKVDEYSRTSVPSIWAIGDVTDRIALTPVALMEGMALVRTVIQGEPTKPDYRCVASAVFTQPPVATVGLTEAQAIEALGDVDIYTSSFRPMKATLSGLPDRTFMKLVVDAKTNAVVGCHMVGDDSPEIMQGLAIAVKAGCTKAQFDATIGIHPTAAEEFVTMRSPTRQLRKAPVTPAVLATAK